MMSDLVDCILTYEKSIEELERIELRLAKDLGLDDAGIHQTLLHLDSMGELKETDLVRDWREALAECIDWEC